MRHVMDRGLLSGACNCAAAIHNKEERLAAQQHSLLAHACCQWPEVAASRTVQLHSWQDAHGDGLRKNVGPS